MTEKPSLVVQVLTCLHFHCIQHSFRDFANPTYLEKKKPTLYHKNHIFHFHALNQHRANNNLDNQYVIHLTQNFLLLKTKYMYYSRYFFAGIVG